LSGHIGTSETTIFSLVLPFSTLPVATVSVVVAVVVAAGLLVYLKKRRPKSEGKP